MSIQKVILYWKQSGEKDFEVAQGLFKLKHYSHCLFFCHLSLEKLLKATVVQNTQKHAPHLHDLVVLAKKAGLELSKKQQNELETITSFNIQGRYADVKSQFYKKFNRRDVAKKYLDTTQHFILWLTKQLNQK